MNCGVWSIHIYKYSHCGGFTHGSANTQPPPLLRLPGLPTPPLSHPNHCLAARRTKYAGPTTSVSSGVSSLTQRDGHIAVSFLISQSPRSVTPSRTAPTRSTACTVWPNPPRAIPIPRSVTLPLRSVANIVFSDMRGYCCAMVGTSRE